MKKEKRKIDWRRKREKKKLTNERINGKKEYQDDALNELWKCGLECVSNRKPCTHVVSNLSLKQFLIFLFRVLHSTQSKSSLYLLLFLWICHSFPEHTKANRVQSSSTVICLFICVNTVCVNQLVSVFSSSFHFKRALYFDSTEE